MKYPEIQDIYTCMQIARMKLRCCNQCVMNVAQKELLFRIIQATDNNLIYYRSIACAYGIYLNELSVWNTLGVYTSGLYYRFYCQIKLKKEIISITGFLYKFISKKKDSTRIPRIQMMLDHYITQLLTYKNQMQALK